MHVMTVLGARPQFIKAAMVSRELARKPGIRETLLHTGQHFDLNMSDIFFQELEIPAPAYHLNICGGNHGEMTGRMLETIERILISDRPDLVLVYGDTNSTLAGALAAAKLHIPVAHVEAGLRSFNPRMPEEINRILTDHVSDMLFAPTAMAMQNLRNENFAEDSMFLVGDVMYDAVLHFRDIAFRRSDILASARLQEREYVLCTIHRAENTGDLGRMRTIFSAILQLSQHIPVVLPLHPRTRSVIRDAGIDLQKHEHLRLLDPVGYFDMTRLEAAASVIVTDSGGVQKEAFFHRVPCVTLRDETEWTELVRSGWNQVVPPDNVESILTAIRNAIGSAGADCELYGQGDAAVQIANRLVGKHNL